MRSTFELWVQPDSLGFEPKPRDSKSLVLPLHYKSISLNTLYHITTKSQGKCGMRDSNSQFLLGRQICYHYINAATPKEGLEPSTNRLTITIFRVVKFSMTSYAKQIAFFQFFKNLFPRSVKTSNS